MRMRTHILFPFLLIIVGLGLLAASSAAAAQSAAPTATPYALHTSTPNPDGSVVHEVVPGESLWNIALAYGVSIDRITTLNRLQPTPVIQPGQKLVMQPSFTPTTAPTVTRTPRPPTRTPQPTRTRPASTATYTATAAPTATPEPPLPVLARIDRRTIGISLIVTCALGILIVLIAPFRSKP